MSGDQRRGRATQNPTVRSALERSKSNENEKKSEQKRSRWQQFHGRSVKYFGRFGVVLDLRPDGRRNAVTQFIAVSVCYGVGFPL
ncbi:hypothetical protein [Paraburkholderia sp. GAS333]|uniref:hypothetical protein n=1 Tax=Paraburkholderia sp. GAS333 TaxID=3156279 RepID=UPI003D213AC0